MNIDTSLLREKFVIREKDVKTGNKCMEFVALSNRMPITLISGEHIKETFVVRSSNMHCCARLIAQILNEFQRRGPIAGRIKNIDWHQLWDNSLSAYERLYNVDRWCAVFYKGKNIFTEGFYHPFLDVVEKCDALNKGKYENSVLTAENAFSQVGKNVKIDYDSNVALVTLLTREEARCSMIVRGPGRTTTINCSIRANTKGDNIERLNLPLTISTAADILESIQLCYFIGVNNEKLNLKVFEKYSEEYYQTIDAKKRLNEIHAQLSSTENRFKVRYRPERPNFEHLITLTERYIRNYILADDEEYIE